MGRTCLTSKMKHLHWRVLGLYGVEVEGGGVENEEAHEND